MKGPMMKRGSDWKEGFLFLGNQLALDLLNTRPVQNGEAMRKCGECVLHFYDTSKKGTRRWYSMQLCGNRLKVAAYATRQRES